VLVCVVQVVAVVVEVELCARVCSSGGGWRWSDQQRKQCNMSVQVLGTTTCKWLLCCRDRRI
jgi:hypothetical protein